MDGYVIIAVKNLNLSEFYIIIFMNYIHKIVMVKGKLKNNGFVIIVIQNLKHEQNYMNIIKNVKKKPNYLMIRLEE